MSLLGVLEDRYPMLRGIVRDHVTQKRRPMVRTMSGWRMST